MQALAGTVGVLAFQIAPHADMSSPPGRVHSVCLSNCVLCCVVLRCVVVLCCVVCVRGVGLWCFVRYRRYVFFTLPAQLYRSILSFGFMLLSVPLRFAPLLWVGAMGVHAYHYSKVLRRQDWVGRTPPRGQLVQGFVLSLALLLSSVFFDSLVVFYLSVRTLCICVCVHCVAWLSVVLLGAEQCGKAHSLLSSLRWSRTTSLCSRTGPSAPSHSRSPPLCSSPPASSRRVS